MAGHPIFAALYDRMLARAERRGLGVEAPDRAAAEIARVLRPEGRLPAVQGHGVLSDG